MVAEAPTAALRHLKSLSILVKVRNFDKLFGDNVFLSFFLLLSDAVDDLVDFGAYRHAIRLVHAVLPAPLLTFTLLAVIAFEVRPPQIM